MILQTETISMSLRDWIELFGTIFALAGVWWRLENKVNGFGQRTDAAVLSAATATTLGQRVLSELDNAHTDRSELRERIASVETRIDTVKEVISEDRLAVMTTLHNNERSATERDVSLRVELAQLKERMDIRQIVQNVVREYKGGI